MGRKKAELHPSQQKPELFAKIRAEIREFSVDYLATLGNVSHTTIHVYARGGAVSDKKYQAIMDVLKEAKRRKEQQRKAALKEAEALVSDSAFAELSN